MRQSAEASYTWLCGVRNVMEVQSFVQDTSVEKTTTPIDDDADVQQTVQLRNSSSSGQTQSS